MDLRLDGHPLHTRSLTVVVTQRDDGRWDVRGDLIDLRKCSFVPMMSDIQPAGIIHHMTIELCFEPGARRIDEIKVEQPMVAIEPSALTQGESCRDPAPRLLAFKGECIDPTFAKKLSRQFGGALGCTHLLTLFQLMAGALVSLPEREAALLREEGAERGPGERLFRRAVFVDGCDLDGGPIGLGLQLADYQTRPERCVGSVLDRIARHAEVRVEARVEMPGAVIEGLCAAERERSSETLATAPWRDRTAALRAFEGTPLMGGFAGRLIGELGSDVNSALLLEAMLQLAPGYIQVLAAIMERWFAAPPDAASPRDPRGGGGLSITTVGGMPNSCYMWRDGSPMQILRSDAASQGAEEKG